MQDIVLQNNLIETLDNVVLRIEEIVTDQSALTQINIDILKNDVRTLYKTICQIEQTLPSYPDTPIHKLKNSVEDLKRKVEQQIESEAVPKPIPNPDAFSFRPVVEDESPDTPDTGRTEEMPASSSASPGQAIAPESFQSEPDSTILNGGTSLANSSSNPNPDEPVFPEIQNQTIQNQQNGSHQDILPSPRPSSQSDPDSRPLPDSLPEEGTEREPGQDPASTQTRGTEAGIPGIDTVPAQADDAPGAPDLSDFMPKADEEPESYVTELTAMAQANAKEQDMSRIAVSSTAMPDEKVARMVANRWNAASHEPRGPQPAGPDRDEASRPGIFSRLKETEALKQNPQNGLKDLFEKLKSNRTVNDSRQRQAQDLRSLIGLNEKFLFINKLFKGNINDYKQMLDQFDQAESRIEIENILQPLKDKYQWDTESLAYITLADLISKKFPEA